MTRLVFSTVLALALVGCKSDPSGGAADGPTIYQTSCALCHGPAGKPTEQMIAQLAVKDLTAPELRARITPAFVEQQVRAGSPNKLMPAFAGALGDAQIKAVAAYVAGSDFPGTK